MLESLRTALNEGEAGVWERFVEKYSRFVYTVALRLLSGVPNAQEVAAAVYSRTFGRLAAFAGWRSAWPWN